MPAGNTGKIHRSNTCVKNKFCGCRALYKNAVFIIQCGISMFFPAGEKTVSEVYG